MAHLDGAKAILMFIPCTKGHAYRDPLRNTFLCAAAALLSVPDLYQETLTQLEITIDPEHQRQTYDALKFGDSHHLGINEVTRFLAFVGVTADEVEQWRQWAAAYIDMELEERPQSDHAPTLRRAKEQTCGRIRNNHDRVVTRVHPSLPRYYNLNVHMGHVAQQAEESTSINAEAGPLTITPAEDAQVSDHPDAIEEEEVSIGFGDNQDEDMAMGPG